jgi:hypothetical protein
MKSALTVVSLLALAACNSAAPTLPTPITPVGSGANWSDPATWGGSVPSATSSVTISAGKTVTIDANVNVREINVFGALTVADKDLEIKANFIMVHGPGVFQVSKNGAPFTKRLTITLKGAATSDDTMGMGAKFLGAMAGGKLEIIGEKRVSWTQLGSSALKGSSTITLKEPVDWRVGERVVIASTATDPSQAEERTITAMSGSSVTLDKPLQYAHYGELQTFAGKTLDERAEVGLLTRNIVIQGDDASSSAKFGGHVMVMGADAGKRETDATLRSSAKIQGVEFRRMGQFDRLGRYPLHWHRNGDSGGDFVRGSSFHSNFQRGVIIHGSDNALVEDNVVFGSVGHSYGTEDGSETGNRFAGNLGLSTQPFPQKASNPAQAAQNDDQAATFWIKGPSNTFVANRAAGGEHVGFWFDDVGTVDNTKFEFRGNTAHSYLIDRNRSNDICCGFEKAALWFSAEDFKARGTYPVTEMTLYKNRTAMWGIPLSDGHGFVDVRLSNSILADNIMGLNSHGAKDTVIVGKSANSDAITSVGAQGIQEYGHTNRLENVTFVNFPNGGAIAHRNCAREAGNVTMLNVKFVNAKINLCTYNADLDNDMAIADTTGSVIGDGAAVTLTPQQNGSRAMYTTDCPVNTALGVRVCKGLLGYSNLHLRGSSSLTLTRDDGVTLGASDVNNYPFYWTTIEGRRYTVNGDVASQASLEFTLTGKFEDDDKSRSVLVKVAASSAFTVYGVITNWFSPPATDRVGMNTLPQVSSLAALESSTTSAYYFDSSAKMVHLKLWTGGVNRVYVDRR